MAITKAKHCMKINLLPFDHSLTFICYRRLNLTLSNRVNNILVDVVDFTHQLIIKTFSRHALVDSNVIASSFLSIHLFQALRITKYSE